METDSADHSPIVQALVQALRHGDRVLEIDLSSGFLGNLLAEEKDANKRRSLLQQAVSFAFFLKKQKGAEEAALKILEALNQLVVSANELPSK